MSASLTKNIENLCRGSGWIKRYIFSPGNGTVIFFFMDIRVTEASKCA